MLRFLKRIRARWGGAGTDTVPAEVAAAIATAEVIFRHDTDPQGVGVRVAVRLVGFGMFYFAKDEDFLDRLEKRFPEMSDAARRRAVQLLEQRIASENRRHWEGGALPERGRGSWMAGAYVEPPFSGGRH